MSVGKGVHGALTAVLSLNGFTATLAEEEVDAANNGGKEHDADNDTGSDAGLVGTARRRCLGGRCGGTNDSLDNRADHIAGLLDNGRAATALGRPS